MSEDDYWARWHEAYEDPTSERSRRLATVQRQLRAALDGAPEGEVRLLSMCAGEGRDVIEVLADHPRAGDVRALLVERSSELAARAVAAAAHHGLGGVQVLAGDASLTDAYAAVVPAHVLLVCGVFGSISQAEIEATVAELGHLATTGAVAIWTKQSSPPDLREWVRSVFVAAGLEELAYATEEGATFGVGSNRWSGSPLAFRPGRKMFDFRPRTSPAGAS
ncbi:MAG TPA: class I SAM-dependent methyltransferase family protein [Acidimicrobiales bacterium]|nr:class I SAM-dependent methyltransferase family protein [Acidimicrobiales bacterium]